MCVLFSAGASACDPQRRVRRERLIELSSGGEFGSAALRRALAELDASQINLELRLESAD